MNSDDFKKLGALLKEYADLPEYSGIEIRSVNVKGLFGNYPINIAATRGFLDEVAILLSHGADVNAVGEHGYTPLHDAVEQGCAKVVELLIKSGSDISAKTNDGDTPVELARKLKETRIVHLLQQIRDTE